jgi:outer membrane receptor protein involved in Fe transport
MDNPAPGTTQIFGSNDNANPRHTWMLRGLWNLPKIPVELDSTVWYVSALDGLIDANGNTIPAYWRLDLRAGWKATEWLMLEFVAQNVTSDAHPEFGEAPTVPLFPGTWVPRSYYGKVTLTF